MRLQSYWSDEMDDDKKLSYFCLGLGIGVAVGVLFAPKAGDETRQIIRGKAEEGKDFIRRRAEGFKGQAEELVDRSKDVLAQKKEQVSAAMEAGKQAYREAVAGESAG